MGLLDNYLSRMNPSVSEDNNDGGEINISASGHEGGNIDFGNLFKEKGVYGALEYLNKDRDKDYADEVRRTKMEKATTFLGELANLGGQAIASSMGVRKFSPIQSQVPKFNERLQRLRDAKRADDAQYADKSLSAVFKDHDNKLREDQFNQRIANENRKQESEAARYKTEFEYKLGRDKADDEHRKETLGETKRHNAETERVSATRVATSAARAGKNGNTNKGKSEVAYVTKYGNASFDNPKNKRAATLSTLEIMRNGATDAEQRKSVDKIINSANEDIDSYNKAEMYVSRHLNGDAVALKHLYELADKYGKIETVGSQKQLRDNARGKSGWSLND